MFVNYNLKYVKIYFFFVYNYRVVNKTSRILNCEIKIQIEIVIEKLDNIAIN